MTQFFAHMRLYLQFIDSLRLPFAAPHLLSLSLLLDA